MKKVNLITVNDCAEYFILNKQEALLFMELYKVNQNPDSSKYNIELAEWIQKYDIFLFYLHHYTVKCLNAFHAEDSELVDNFLDSIMNIDLHKEIYSCVTVFKTEF